MTSLTLVVVALLGGAPKAAPASASGFWSWMATNEVRLADATKVNPRAAMEEISSHLETEKPGLIAEVGVEPKGPHLLVVSADGDKKLFPAVKELAAAAPALKRWKVVAFRPRGDVAGTTIEIGSTKISAADYFFRETGRGGGKIDIEIFCKGLSEQNRKAIERVAFLFLDQIVGEYDTETKVGAIEVNVLPSKPGADVRPLTALAKAVDTL
jgi:hypothetical protein